MQDIRAWLATACRGVQVLDLSSIPSWQYKELPLEEHNSR